MNKNEHLLTILSEECNEVAQRVSKALRFGLEEIQSEQLLTNAERITIELEDLFALMEMCRDANLIPGLQSKRIHAKKAKVNKYLSYSLECGTLK